MAADAVDVAIVGGGIAGLSAAHTLNTLGVPHVLIEASDRLGGVVRTERVEGFVLEAGADAMLVQKPAAVALAREIGLGDRLIPTNPTMKTVFILHRGRLRALPDGMMLGVPTRFLPMVTTRLFSWPAKLRMAREILTRPGVGDADDDESIASFLGRHFGREAVERLGEPLLAGIHAGDPEQLSMASAFPRFVAMEKTHGSLIRAMWKGPRPKGAGFVSFPAGLSELTDALAARVGRHARLGWPARVLRATAAGWEIENADGAVQMARALILGIPAAAGARLLGSVDAGLAEALGALRSVSTAVVYLGFRRADIGHALDGYGVLIPRSEGLTASALTFVSTKFPGRAPDGHVLLRAFFGGAREPGILDHDDATLIARAVDEMDRVLGVRRAPVVARVFRWRDGTPQMDVGHAARMSWIDAQADAHPGLFLTGSGLRGTGIPDMVADGARQARRAAAQLTGRAAGSEGSD